eukprot:291633-Heterocapsa_arctica.AAC.1
MEFLTEEKEEQKRRSEQRKAKNKSIKKRPAQEAADRTVLKATSDAKIVESTKLTNGQTLVQMSTMRLGKTNGTQSSTGR